MQQAAANGLFPAAETRLQEQVEQQTAERNERLKEQAEKSVSYEEYQRMKPEGRMEKIKNGEKVTCKTMT